MLKKIKLKSKELDNNISQKIKIKLKKKDVIDPQLNIEKQGFVLSIDVAIKHLSFCILYNSQIYDWKLIDLLEDNYLDYPQCTTIQKNKSKCTNTASWRDDEYNYYCGIHNNDSMYKLPKKLTCYCGALAKYINYDNKGECANHINYDNNGECAKHKSANSKRWYTVDNISDIELRILLFKKLDSFNFININVVLIERQPKLATEKMRSLAYAIYDYFIIKSDYSEDLIIEWIDPKNKLYVYSGPIITCPIKNQYDRNKWFACKYCTWNLEQNNETNYLDFFNKNKKQDDLADCYLQGLYYITKNKRTVMSDQQRQIYTDQNIVKFKKTKGRKPNNLTKKLTLQGLKYYIMRREINAAVKASAAFYFGNLPIEKLY